MTYIINKTDNTIVFDHGNLGRSFRTDNWRECTDEELTNYQVEELRKAKLPSRLAYLNSTDWYIVRKTERNIDIPENITNNRLKALEEYDNISLLNSIDELEQITDKFELSEGYNGFISQ